MSTTSINNIPIVDIISESGNVGNIKELTIGKEKTSMF